MRCAFCQHGDISAERDSGEEVEARTLAAMAWTLRREGCHNINWVGGEVVIHLHAIVDAIALLGRGFAPSPAEIERARRTKADRSFFFRACPAPPSTTGASTRRSCGTAIFHEPGIDEDPAHPLRRVVARPEIRARAM